ncbi:MAG: amidohydrolase [Alphaproteobacteria bacterium]|nr:amidohydrolase [Alphaproteobacteria bacterium]
MPIVNRIADFHADLTEWRQDLHAHPEIGFEEHRTSEVVASKLASFGIEVHRGLGGTGVVGVLRSGTSGRTIGLRADMDALPMDEHNDFPHASQNPGRMHACGHDGHTTMLLGAARYLAETRNFDGTVHFIFQPAEEGLGGAKAMVEQGLFESFPCDVVFGMHNAPGLPIGQFALRPGPMMAGGALFDITITGKGAHGAKPQEGIDPILVAAQVVNALQSIVSRNVSPIEAAVVSVTKFHGGDAYNVIPDSVTLAGTARAFAAPVLDAIGPAMRRIAEGVAAAFGATANLDFRPTFPPLVNHEKETIFAGDMAARVVGEGKVNRDGELVSASEDFSLMLNQRPGAFIFIGNGGQGEPGSCPVHNPHYDFNDAILPLGASYWTQLVEGRLAR